MTLHIFNPEHDIALAFGADNFTAPHAGRQLRHDLCWIPAIWANDGDAVLVADDDKDLYDRLLRRIIRPRVKTIRWVTERELASLAPDKIEPWGWDIAITSFLRRRGIDTSLLHDNERLEKIRHLSSRHTAKKVLEALRTELPDVTCGEMHIASSMDQALLLSTVLGESVLKSPWSSSGRGVRFVSTEIDKSTLPWVRKTIETQGSIMVEHKENKIADFAMEFTSDGNGNADYTGLSVFLTNGTAYSGNLIMPEEEKYKYLQKWIDKTTLDSIKDIIISQIKLLTSSIYSGPLGVDMMVVPHPTGNGFCVHPCVEINLRHTMGMVAISLASESDITHPKTMQVYYDGNYHLTTKLG